MEHCNLFDVIITNINYFEQNGLHLVYGDVESKHTKQRGIVGIAHSYPDACKILDKIEDYYDRVNVRKTRTRWKQDHWNIQEEDYKEWRK